MSNWKEYKIGDVCNTISDTYKDNAGEVVLINTSDVLDGKCLNHQKVPNKNLKGQFKKKFQRDDILYSEIRPANKRFAYIDFDAKDYIASTKLMVIRHNDKILPEYLFYILKSQDVIDELQMLAESRSGTFPQITFSELARLHTLLPSLKEQKHILDVLKSIDDKIECNRRVNDNLEQQAQALFDRVLMNEKLPRDKVLKDYAFINPTRSIKKSEIARYIDMSSLPTKGSFPLDWVDKPYNGGMKFQNGDTLMARITPCLENGKTAYINFLDKEEIAFGSTEYIVMAPHEGIPSELFYFLARNNDFVSYAVAHMNGSSGRQRVSAADIENYIMPNIPSNIIEQFGERAKNTMECIKNNSIESRRLAELRDTLLPKLMSGEINVNEVCI